MWLVWYVLIFYERRQPLITYCFGVLEHRCSWCPCLLQWQSLRHGCTAPSRTMAPLAAPKCASCFPSLLSELTLDATIVQSVATASKGVATQYLIRSMRTVWRWPRIQPAIQRSAWHPRKIRLSPSSAWKDSWSKSHAIWAFVKMQTVTCRNEHEFYNLERSRSIWR